MRYCRAVANQTDLDPGVLDCADRGLAAGPGAEDPDFDFMHALGVGLAGCILRDKEVYKL